MWLLPALAIFLLGHTSVTVAVSSGCGVSTSSCRCNDADIICSNTRLSTWPSFTLTTNKFSNIYLDGNRFTSIRKQAFANLATTEEVYISLSGNSQLLSFDPAAFSDLAGKNITLNVSNVRLAHNFGRAFKGVNIVELHLDMQTSLDGATLFTLSETLVSLSLGLGSVSKWPSNLNLLRRLKKLTVFHEQSIPIPINAFDDMEDTLLHLTFLDARHLRIPDAVCSLHRLESLTMARNAISAENNPAPVCQKPMDSVKSLTLSNVGLTRFPDVIDMFPNLTQLDVSNNPKVTFIPDDVKGNYITTLNLTGNGFKQISSSVRTMHSLKVIDLSNNDISTVDRNDLRDFPPISKLILAGNPLAFISNYAFQTLPSLKYLDLRRTNFTEIPRAFVAIGQGFVADLGNNKIKCNCDMLWLHSWSGLNSSSLLGNCEFSEETFASFIHGELTECIHNN